MDTSLDKIIQLLESGNAKLALTLLNGQKDLEAKVLAHFQPLLNAFGKKTLRAVSKILGKIQADQLTYKEQTYLWAVSPYKEKIEKLHIFGYKKRGNYIPKTLRYLNKLKELKIENISVGSFPEEIMHLKQLERLDFSTHYTNSTIQLPNTFDRLPLLKYLSFNNSGKTSGKMPSSITKLTELEHLEITHTLKKIHKHIGQLSTLKTLSLCHNNLSKLPASITKLQDLETLNLRYNKFEVFPTQIIQLNNLKYLLIAGNPIKKLPDEIYKLSHLKYIGLSQTQMTKLPNTFQRLSELEVLFLQDIEITNLEVLEGLPKLKHLLVKNYHPVIKELKSLEILSLEDRTIETLPNGLDQLINLRKLELDGSGIKNITSKKCIDIFSNLNKLESLSIDNWSNIPNQEFDQLEKLFPNLEVFPNKNWREA